jgi:hypothetical protein
MGSAQAGPGFDEGVFLVHLNKGKQLLGRGSLEEARRELEKARSLRPEEDRVLNLLGMLYFKMERHEEAREIYERLIKLHPDEGVLHLNLGIIELKENRLGPAESYLQRACQIDPQGPKPHMYLGLLYNKKEDLERASEHLKKAGAAKLLEKVEQKRRQRSASQVDGTDQVRGRASFRVQSEKKPVPEPAMEAPPPPDIAVGVQEDALAAPDIDSILEGLSALGDTPPGVVPTPSAPVLDPEPEAPPPSAPVSAAAPSPPEPATPPAVPLEPGTILDLGAAPIQAARLGSKAFGPFRRPGVGLLEMEIDRQALLRRGSVTHYSGRLEFTRDRSNGLIRVEGKGSLFLAEQQDQTLLVELAGHSICVSSTHLLACSEGVRVAGEPLTFGGGENGLRALRLVGHGCVALVVQGQTICLDVEVEQPAAADPRRVVAWSGDLRAEALASEILREVMTAGHQGVLSVRFEGKGTVLVEQPVAVTPSS